jgi:hypothetical protein
MKKIKLIIAIFVATALVFSCNPKDKKTEPATTENKRMSYEQLSKEIGNENALKAFDKAGLTETSSDPSARGAKKPKPNAQLTVVEDLVLTQVSGNDFSSTTSVNAQWFSYQVFVPGAGNDGAYAICNHYYNAAGDAPNVELCTITTSGNIRTFTSDFNYLIHLSNVVLKP